MARVSSNMIDREPTGLGHSHVPSLGLRCLQALIVLAVFTTAVGALTCSRPDSPGYVQEANDAIAKWNAKGPPCYRVTISRVSGVVSTIQRVFVCKGRVGSRVNVPPGERLIRFDEEGVEGLFKEIESEIESAPPVTVRARYDPQSGYPVSVSVKGPDNLSDAWISIDVSDLERVDCSGCVVSPGE